MKKLFAVLLTMSMAFSLAACSNDNDGGGSGSGGDSNAGAWPEKNINIIVTHSPGGDTDYNARLMARMLEEELGVSVVCNNVEGSNGAIALAQYKDENPDGYTFVMTNTAALTGNEATGISDFGYESFEVVSVYAKQAGENIIVPADSPYETLQDLIDASIENPGSIKFGISTGGGVYIASVIMEQSYGAQFTIVEAGDAASRLTDLLGGHVDATIVPYSNIKEYIEAGQIKSLCTLLEERPSLIPDVPAASETHPELVLNTLYACLAPAGTDAEIVQAMNDAIMNIVANNDDYKAEVNSFNFQDPWALSVTDSIEELRAQRELFMKFADSL